MTLYILIFLVIFLIPVVIGIAYFGKRLSVKREAEHRRGEEPKNGTPVTLDRNPNMPKMPGATS